MASEIRKQIRDAATTALTGLTTTGSKVYPSRVYEMQAADLPGLRIFTNNQTVEQVDVAVNPTEENRLELLIEGCAKSGSGMDDTLDAIVKEVRIALAGAQTLGGAKRVSLKTVEVEMEGEAEAPRGVVRLTFEVLYYSAQNAPDVAI